MYWELIGGYNRVSSAVMTSPWSSWRPCGRHWLHHACLSSWGWLYPAPQRALLRQRLGTSLQCLHLFRILSVWKPSYMFPGPTLWVLWSKNSYQGKGQFHFNSVNKDISIPHFPHWNALKKMCISVYFLNWNGTDPSPGSYLSYCDSVVILSWRPLHRHAAAGPRACRWPCKLYTA